MGLGLGTRLGEYKDPETQVPRLRRPRSVTSSRWNGYSVEISNAVNNCSYHNIGDFSESEVEKVTVQMLIKPDIHNQIFELIYYGQGFTHDDVYSMPTYLRNFYYKKLIEVKKKENDQIKKAKSKKQSTIPKFKR